MLKKLGNERAIILWFPINVRSLETGYRRCELVIESLLYVFMETLAFLSRFHHVCSTNVASFQMP